MLLREKIAKVMGRRKWLKPYQICEALHKMGEPIRAESTITRELRRMADCGYCVYKKPAKYGKVNCVFYYQVERVK